ncbi:MAG: hypothetical protein ACLFS8_00040 [Clostridia bacterium]
MRLDGAEVDSPKAPVGDSEDSGTYDLCTLASRGCRAVWSNRHGYRR